MSRFEHSRNSTLRVELQPKALTKSNSLFKNAAQWFTKNPMFVAIVALPNLLSLIYFLFIASPIYISTATLTVFNPAQTSSSIVSLLSGGSSDGSAEEAYILRDYMLSWTEFQKLSAGMNLKKAYAAGDFVSRYGGLSSFFNVNDVALWHYYQSRLDIQVDVKSGVILINVDGYSPKFSHRLSQQLLKDGVAHMDAMNSQQENDFVADAKAQAVASQAAVIADEAALDNYRRQIGVFDPSVLYASQLALLNTMVSQETQMEVQYTVMAAGVPNSPSAVDFRKAIAKIKSRKDAVQATIPQIAEEAKTYEALLVTRNDDESVLRQTAEAVHDAALKAQQNRYYLDVISAPSMPETAELPKRLEWVAGIFFASIVIWGLLR